MSTSNTDLLWIFLYVFYAVAAVGAVLAVVGLRVLVQDLRQPATVRAMPQRTLSAGRRTGRLRRHNHQVSTTAFVNGSVFDGHHHLGRRDRAGRGRARRGRRGARRPARGHGRRRHRRPGRPGFRRRPRARRAGWSRTHPLRPHPQAAPARTTSPWSRRTPTTHPDVPWILGGGWAMAAFPGGTPVAADLDAVVPDRPVFLPNRDHHGAWVNTRALELAGITRESPEPPHGRVERDPDGHPTGTLHEGAMHLVSRLLPETSADDYYDGLLAGQAFLHSLGVTGWQDAIVGAYAGMDDPGPTYLHAAQRGDLTAHVVGALWWDRERGDEQVASLRRASRGVHPRAVPGHEREGDAGRRRRERHRRHDRAVPRPLRARHRQQRPLLRRSRGPASLRRPPRRRGLPGPRARHRRPRRPRGPRRVRDGGRVRPAAPHRPPPAGPPRRRTPLRRARRRRQRAGPLGLPRRPDGRADDALPRRGTQPAGSTRSAPCTAPAPASSRAATGR